MKKALRFEEFSPTADPTDGVLRMETRDQAYARGMKDGAQAAQNAYDNQFARTMADVRDRLEDFNFSAVEARASVMRSLKPLVSGLLDTLAPRLVKEGLFVEIQQAVEAAAARMADDNIILRAPVGIVEKLKDQFEGQPYGVEIIADSTLADTQIQVHWDNGYDGFDVASALTDVRIKIDQFFEIAAEPNELKVVGNG